MPTRQNDNSIRSRIKRSRAIDKKINILDRRVDELYKDIYVSRTDNIHNIDTIIDDIDNTIDKIQGMDSSASSMSELLRRVDQKETGNTEAMLNSVSELFSNDNLLSSVFMNDDVHRFISAQNYNYDLICKYLPRLNDALEILRDNVLCSDNFDKKFLNPREPNLSKDAIALFKSNADKLDDKYELSEFLDDTYMKTSKYGEDFIYIVPYPVAFKRMFERERRVSSTIATQQSLFEGYNEVKLLSEGYGESKEFISYAHDVESYLESSADSVLKSMPELGEINIFFNNTGMVNSAVHEYAVLKEKEALPIMESLSSLYESAGSLNSTNMTGVFKDAINSKGRRNKVLSGLNNDGLVLDKNLDRDPEKIDQDMLGAVLERLPREDVIPVYMGKKCLGYYYFEFAEDKTACGYCGGHHLTPGLGNAARYHYDSSMDHQELVARYVSSRISRVIDSKFINANKDLKEEIYAILRYNERFDITRKNNIGVTFIPAEDIIHCYFKLNEKTHRGISDLENSLIPAMLYILLYLTDIIGRITRSTDKRVYYVKQNVETNVARTMMNVVAQIKKGSRKAMPSILSN